MFKRNIKIGALLFCLTLSIPAWAGDNPFYTALTSDPWVYTGFVYNPKENNAGWYKGEVRFNANKTVDIRTVGSSGNFDPTVTSEFQYSVDDAGKVTITALNGKDAYPYLAGQMSTTLDKISAVMTINNVGPNNLSNPSPGQVVLIRKSTVAFSNLDLVGQWGGSEFINNGKDGIGWESFDLSIDSLGKVTGSVTSYNGNVGSITGTSSIDTNGIITMSIINDQDKNSTVTVSAQMSKGRDAVSFAFQPVDKTQAILGVGLMFKK